MARLRIVRSMIPVIDGGGSGGGGTSEIEKEHLYYEDVRLAHNIPGEAVVGRAVVPNPLGGTDLVAAQAFTNGNVFTLSGEWKSFEVIWSRETPQNGQIDINGRCYKAGFGPIYPADLPGFESTIAEFYNQEVVFTLPADDPGANPPVVGAFVEIKIIRKV